MAMKVDTGSCTACGAKNSKFVEKCYKCHAVLPWGAGYRAPAPQATPTQLVTPAPAVPAPSLPAMPPRPAAPPAFDPLAPPPARTVMYPETSAPASSPAVAPSPYQDEIAPPPSYSEAAFPNAYPQQTYPVGIGPMGPMICQSCGYSGHGQSFMEGSTWVGVLLCLLWLLPGLVYFIWQSTTKYEGCPQCKSRALVPLHSPAGQFSSGHFYGQ